MTDIIETCLTIHKDNCHLKAGKLLAEHTGLSQSKIKDAMVKGAVWWVRGRSKKRLRRASKSLQAGDQLELNFNSAILGQEVPAPTLIHDAQDYSIWYKPYGLSCQGSRWGDFASLNRWVEIHLSECTGQHSRPAFLVHRLDRATTGLILLCHAKSAARLFSEMFREGNIDKRYQAIVHGDFSEFSDPYSVKLPVDGKPSHSVFSHQSGGSGLSLVNVQLLSGRKHQIRKHLASLGYPIVGDRLYGNGEEDGCDLQLQSVSLQFDCPLSGEKQCFTVADHLKLRIP